MATIELSEPVFAETIDNNEIVILDFWAEWCGPCKAYGPVYERVSEEFPNVLFAKINTEEQPELGRMFNIRSIPTTIAFKQQIGVFMQPGALPEDALRDLVKMLETLDMDEVREENEKTLEETSETLPSIVKVIGNPLEYYVEQKTRTQRVSEAFGVGEIEEDVKARAAPKLWNYYAEVSIGGTQNNNVNSVTKNRLQDSSDSVIPFNSPMYDRTYTQSLGLTASRTIGEGSAFSMNLALTDSRQNFETSDDLESYGLTFALDTTVGNQALSPYLITSKTDNKDDATAFSFMSVSYTHLTLPTKA